MTKLNRSLQTIMLLSCCAAMVVVGVLSPAARAWGSEDTEDANRDKVYLLNGDRVSGKIKELDRGRLRVKTITMDTVYLNWVDVDYIESRTFLRISRTNGTFQYGRLAKSAGEQSLSIVNDGHAVDIPALEVASMRPIRVDEALWNRFEGEVSAGIDYKKASDILLVNLSSSVRLRVEEYEVAFGLDWNETQRTENNNSSRAEFISEYSRFLADRWFWKASLGLERNQELGIDLRQILGGTAGRYLVQSATKRFEVSAGLAASTENKTDGTQRESLEGLIRSSFDLFKLDVPVTRLSANVSFFPGITETGRIRVNSNISLRNELFRDFFWNLSFYSSYDNQPAEGAGKEDFGVVTGIGASF